MSNVIAVVGMGWLGLPFAQRLLTLGFRVKGTVSTIEKATSLQKHGLDVYPIEISEDGISGPIKAFLRDVETIVIMIPPGLRRNTGANHVLKMTHLLNEINQSDIQNLILVSSIAVYNDTQGKVTERDAPQPDTVAGKQLLSVEQMFFNSEINTTIVRFGGLFGGNRQPARYIAGRENLRNGHAPVNLIHRNDCIGILSEIISQQAFGYVFNGVSPEHPVKEVYYTNKAKELNLELPQYSSENEPTTFKQVDSETLKAILNYKFKRSI